MNESSLPLDGIRVLDLSRVLAGPYCAALLADLGAEVIKVEGTVNSDELRRWPPAENGESAAFIVNNRNKRGIAVDLKTPEGAEIIRRLANPIGQWIAPFGAVLIGLMGVLGTNYLIVFVVPPAAYELTIFIVLGLALLGEVLMRPILIRPPASAVVFWVPFGFHLFFLVAGLLSGVILQPPFLLVMSVLMLVTAVYLHRPWSRRPLTTGKLSQ